MVHNYSLEFVYTDLRSPSPVLNTNGFLYCATIVHALSRFTWISPLKQKFGFFIVLQ